MAALRARDLFALSLWHRSVLEHKKRKDTACSNNSSLSNQQRSNYNCGTPTKILRALTSLKYHLEQMLPTSVMVQGEDESIKESWPNKPQNSDCCHGSHMVRMLFISSEITDNMITAIFLNVCPIIMMKKCYYNRVRVMVCLLAQWTAITTNIALYFIWFNSGFTSRHFSFIMFFIGTDPLGRCVFHYLNYCSTHRSERGSQTIMWNGKVNCASLIFRDKQKVTCLSTACVYLEMFYLKAWNYHFCSASMLVFRGQWVIGHLISTFLLNLPLMEICVNALARRSRY